SNNARSILPMVPAVGILAMRRAEDLPKKPLRLVRLLPHVVASLALAFSVGWADFKLADANPTAAADLWKQYGSPAGTFWFQGHWGFQFYMESLGAKPADTEKSELTDRDVVVVPENNTNTFPLPKEWFRLRSTLQVPSTSWLSTMNSDVGAAF